MGVRDNKVKSSSRHSFGEAMPILPISNETFIGISKLASKWIKPTKKEKIVDKYCKCGEKLPQITSSGKTYRSKICQKCR